MFWQPEWQQPDPEVFRSKVDVATSGEGWVADGNYSRVRDLLFSRVDTVVWLDLPLLDLPLAGGPAYARPGPPSRVAVGTNREGCGASSVATRWCGGSCPRTAGVDARTRHSLPTLPTRTCDGSDSPRTGPRRRGSRRCDGPAATVERSRLEPADHSRSVLAPAVGKRTVSAEGRRTVRTVGGSTVDARPGSAARSNGSSPGLIWPEPMERTRHTGREGPLEPGPDEVVGRDEELARVLGFLTASADPPAMLVEGDAGIGKTTLWNWGSPPRGRLGAACWHPARSRPRRRCRMPCLATC